MVLWSLPGVNAQRVLGFKGEPAGNLTLKKKAAHRSAPLVIVILRSGLEGLDVGGLQALGSLGNLEFNRLAVIQRLIAISHNRGEMHEHIFSTLALDETEALAGVKPLHCSLFFTHCVTLFCQPGYG
jgi:hypothetical protein